MRKRQRSGATVVKSDPFDEKLGEAAAPVDADPDGQRGNLVPSVKQVYQTLVRLYGERERRPTGRTVLDALVRTILSQNTTDKLSGAAFRALKTRYPTWSDVLNAPISELEDTIRIGGLAHTKAQRIQTILQELWSFAQKQGDDSDWTQGLEFLRNESTAQVMTFLTRYPGVGPKTAACVAMFTLERDDIFPADTHIYRLGKRLGWVSATRTREQAQQDLENLIPDHWHYPMHLLMIHHGRQVCAAQSPQCEKCALADLGCPSARTAVAKQESSKSKRRGSQRSRKRDTDDESPPS
jgi:endonuclease-3